MNNENAYKRLLQPTNNTKKIFKIILDTKN